MGVKEHVCLPSKFTREHAPTLTRRLYWVIAFLVIIWDVYLAYTPSENDTWSEQMRIAAEKHLFFPWFLGAVIGHLFHFRDRVSDSPRDLSYLTMWGVSITLFALGMSGTIERLLSDDAGLRAGVICATAIAGILAGYSFWPMQRKQRLEMLRSSPATPFAIVGIVVIIVIVAAAALLNALNPDWWSSARQWVQQTLALTPYQTRIVGAVLLALFVAVDVVTTADGTPGNSVREWITRLSFWKSKWLWNHEERAAHHKSARLNPFNYLPATGAFVPFMLSALIGHFFHPWLVAPLEIRGVKGLIILLGVGCLFSLVTFAIPYLKRKEVPVFAMSVLGVIAGGLIWPISVR